MINIKYALIGLGLASAGSLALVSMVPSRAPAVAAEASLPSPTASRSAPNGWGAAMPGAIRNRAKEPLPPWVRPPSARPEVTPPLIANAAAPATAELVADDAQRAERRAARQQERVNARPEQAERRELREQWRALPREKRRAVKQECERQGYDKGQVECLRLAQYADSYALTPKSERNAARPTAQQRRQEQFRQQRREQPAPPPG